MTVDYTKPYCGNCGQQGKAVVLLRYAPDGEPLYICKHRANCQKRFLASLRRGARGK